MILGFNILIDHILVKKCVCSFHAYTLNVLDGNTHEQIVRVKSKLQSYFEQITCECKQPIHNTGYELLYQAETPQT